MFRLIIFLFLSGTIYSQDTTKNEVFTVVETMPEPEGGIQVFRKYLSENIRYPDSAQVKGLEGKVYLKFVVDTSGKITDVTMLKGIKDCPECDEEAMRVLRSYPYKWKPGTIAGKPVSVYYNLPISFNMKR